MSSMEISSEARERAHVLKYIPRQFSSTSYRIYIHIYTKKIVQESYVLLVATYEHGIHTQGMHYMAVYKITGVH